MFEEMEILHKNLQKGVERWFEQDLQQCNRTQEEMQQMTLNRPTERERSLFMMTIDSYLNEAFDKLLERTCKELIQKWSHEGGKETLLSELSLKCSRTGANLRTSNP